METAVLLLVYNRPEQTERVLKRLLSCGARKVFVSADGPKNQTDRVQTEAVRSVLDRFRSIIQKTRYSDANLSCKNGVISGINWFFAQVEEGIILEDDCLPSLHFFPLVNTLLERYRDEEKVMMISGNNPLGEWNCEAGHFFSRIGHSWGWATWKNRWEKFNADLPLLNEFIGNSGFERAFGPTNLAASRKSLTKKSLSGEIDTWDYQWNAHMLMSNGLSAVPETNLIENIGFDNAGTHTFEMPKWISNRISDKPIVISKKQIEADHEYEMEWELARRSNQLANESSSFYSKKGGSNSKPHRILSINSTDVGGGAEKIAFELHHRQLKLGLESKLLVQEKKSSLDSVEEMHNWRTQIFQFNPDVIHVHNLHGTSIKLNELAEISSKIPVLFTLHDSWLSTGSNHHPFALDASKLNLLELLDWKQELAARIKTLSQANIRFTSPSQWMRERMFQAHGIRVFYVPNAVDTFISAEVEFPSERFILFVANRPETNPYKDLSNLKRAWKKANESLGPNGCDLVVLGGIPSTEKILERSIFILENQSSEQVFSFMKKALLVVQASVQDNAPLTILEAHSAGKKVLASLVGGIPEMLDEQERAWMYEAENADDLTSKLVLAILTKSDSTALHHSSIASMTYAYLGHYLELATAH